MYKGWYSSGLYPPYSNSQLSEFPWDFYLGKLVGIARRVVSGRLKCAICLFCWFLFAWECKLAELPEEADFGYPFAWGADSSNFFACQFACGGFALSIEVGIWIWLKQCRRGKSLCLSFHWDRQSYPTRKITQMTPNYLSAF